MATIYGPHSAASPIWGVLLSLNIFSIIVSIISLYWCPTSIHQETAGWHHFVLESNELEPKIHNGCHESGKSTSCKSLVGWYHAITIYKWYKFSFVFAYKESNSIISYAIRCKQIKYDQIQDGRHHWFCGSSTFLQIFLSKYQKITFIMWFY